MATPKAPRANAGIGFSLDVLGEEKLRAALTDPDMVAVPLKEMFEEAGKLAQKTASDGAEGGTGNWATYMLTRAVGPFVNPLSMKYGTMRHLPKTTKMTAQSIEKGRRRGNAPPLFAMVNFIAGRIVSRRRTMGIDAKLLEAAAVLAEHIRKRGTKGRFYMRAAREKVRNESPRLLTEMGDKVEKFFRAKTR